MPTHTPSAADTFASEFLKHYLKGGIGSMSKSDVDALVMHLLDKHGNKSGLPLGTFPNQVASELLRAPLAKIKRLRYEGTLKFGPRPEDEARRRFVLQLAQAGLEFEKSEGANPRMVFVIEDLLARNWIQGQIKAHGGIFDGSFNAEIIRVAPDAFFKLLRALIPTANVDDFEKKYKVLVKNTKREELIAGFKALAASIAKGAAGAGGSLAAKSLVALPLIGG